MKPLRARYSKIEALVNQLLHDNDVKQLPIPVEQIAVAAGAKVVYETFNNEVSGLLLRHEGDQPVIAVEKTQLPNRQRFTVAHELGHLLLHSGEELHVDTQFRVNFRSPHNPDVIDIEEVEANAFAASLLVPWSFLSVDMRGMTLDIEDEVQIKALAKRYAVSSQAMTIRIIGLSNRGEFR